MTTELQFRVYGLPAQQGSKSVNRKTGRMFEQGQKTLYPWRKAVTEATKYAMAMNGFTMLEGPVHAHIIFYFPRPGYHFGTGRNAGVLKPDMPLYKVTKPDVDKLVRSTFDALTIAKVWKDDSLAVKLTTSKVFDTLSGASIRLTALAVTA